MWVTQTEKLDGYLFQIYLLCAWKETIARRLSFLPVQPHRRDTPDSNNPNTDGRRNITLRSHTHDEKMAIDG